MGWSRSPFASFLQTAKAKSVFCAGLYYAYTTIVFTTETSILTMFPLFICRRRKQHHIDVMLISTLAMWVLPALFKPRNTASFLMALLLSSSTALVVALTRITVPNAHIFVCKNSECGMRTCLDCDREVYDSVSWIYTVKASFFFSCGDM